ncbi:hypothetical protein ACKS0A_08872 [Histoplasma ohiense]
MYCTIPPSLVTLPLRDGGALVPIGESSESIDRGRSALNIAPDIEYAASRLICASSNGPRYFDRGISCALYSSIFGLLGLIPPFL